MNSNAALAWAYPPYPRNQWGYIPGVGPRNSIKYGVLAYAYTIEDLGMIYVDDEDSSNKTGLNPIRDIHTKINCLVTKACMELMLQTTQDIMFY